MKYNGPGQRTSCAPASYVRAGRSPATTGALKVALFGEQGF
ncbi:hypothetical protein [Kribbella soli]|nr:hypothetical protein [Kribbella soli]